MFTKLDPGTINLKELDPPRKAVRGCIAMQAGAAVFGVAMRLMLVVTSGGETAKASQAFDTTISVIAANVVAFGVIACIVQILVGLHYLRVLARRVPDAFIKKRVGLYMWLLPVLYFTGYFSFGVGPLIAVVAYWTIHDRLRKHIKSILTVGTPAELGQMGPVNKPAIEIKKFDSAL